MFEFVRFHVNQPQAPTTSSVKYLFSAQVGVNELRGSRLSFENSFALFFVKDKEAAVGRLIAVAHLRNVAKWVAPIHQHCIVPFNQIWADVSCRSDSTASPS